MRGQDGKMNYRNIVLLGLFIFGFLALSSGGAYARSAYLTAFTTKYTATAGTKLDDCNTCHGSGGTSTWNPYGQAIRSLGSAVAIATRITNVEPLDSDGDGIINVTEINGLTFPGDPSDPPVAVAPTITTTSPLPTGTVGTAYSQTFAATGGTTPRTWSVSAGTLPAGLSLSSAGVLSGTPTTAATYSFTVQVTGGGTATKVFSVTINPAAVALSITTASPLPAGTVGTAYSQTFAATGGTTPRTWSVSAGTLPAGLSLSSAGVLSGTPTTAAAYSFTVQVTGGGTATKAFSVTINPAAVALSITTASPLPAGTVGTAYSQTFAATGGTTPQHVVGVLGDASRGPEPLLGGRAERHADDGGGLQLHGPGDRRRHGDEGVLRDDQPGGGGPLDHDGFAAAHRYGGDGVQPDVCGHRGHDAAHVVGVLGDASRGPEPLLGGRAERHADDGGGLQLHGPGDRRRHGDEGVLRDDQPGGRGAFDHDGLSAGGDGGDGVQPDAYGHRGYDPLQLVGVCGDASRGPEPVRGGRARAARRRRRRLPASRSR